MNCCEVKCRLLGEAEQESCLWSPGVQKVWQDLYDGRSSKTTIGWKRENRAVSVCRIWFNTVWAFLRSWFVHSQTSAVSYGFQEGEQISSDSLKEGGCEGVKRAAWDVFQGSISGEKTERWQEVNRKGNAKCLLGTDTYNVGSSQSIKNRCEQRQVCVCFLLAACSLVLKIPNTSASSETSRERWELWWHRRENMSKWGERR